MIKLRTDAEMIETGHHWLFLHAKACQDEIRALSRALNNAMLELRETSEAERLNSFDDVMTRISPEIREYLTVDQSPVFWPDNDFDPTK
jgi:hypothetical protein